MSLKAKLYNIHWFGMLVILISGCTFNNQIPQVTPTLIPSTVTATITLIPTVAATPTPLPVTDTPQPIIQPTNTPLPPTETPLPTATPGPFEHEIKQDETLGYIIQLYGHRSFDVISEIVRINESIINADSLPVPGTVILIPRPTATPLPEGVDPDSVVANPAIPQASDNGLTLNHLVKDGESLIDIAQQYNTTLEIISQLNSEIGFFGCNFNIPSGGPDCIIILQVGQEVIVPAPTPTPTLSPTPSGNETATPTPTHSAPRAVFPPNNGIAQPGIFRLQWVSSGVLAEDEVYIVYLRNITTGGDINAFITRSTAYELPAALIPQDGQSHEFQWWVTVGKANENGVYGDVSGQAEINTFTWQGVN